MLFDHSLGLFRRSNASKHGIEVGRRKPFGKVSVPESVFVDTVLVVPQLLANTFLHGFVFRRQSLAILRFAEQGCNSRQTFCIESVEGIQPDIVEVHGIGMGVVVNLIIHGTVVQACFIFGCLHEPSTSSRVHGAAIAAPFQQAVAITIPPWLAITPISQPPIMPPLKPWVGPLQHFSVLKPLINFPKAVRAHWRLGTVWCDTRPCRDVGYEARFSLSQENCLDCCCGLSFVFHTGQQRAEKTVPFSDHPASPSARPLTTDAGKDQPV